MKFLISLFIIVFSIVFINSQIVKSPYFLRINGGVCGTTVSNIDPYGGCQKGCPVNDPNSGFLNVVQTANDTFTVTKYSDSLCTTQVSPIFSFNVKCDSNYEWVKIDESNTQVQCYIPGVDAPNPVQVDSSSAPGAIYANVVLLIIGLIASLL